MKKCQWAARAGSASVARLFRRTPISKGALKKAATSIAI
jgi:hypothetical protein